MLTQNKNKNTQKCSHTAFSDWNDDSVFTEKKLVVERFGEIIVTLFLNIGASGGVSESVVLPVLAVQRESLSQQIPYNNTNLSWKKQSTHRLQHKPLTTSSTTQKPRPLRYSRHSVEYKTNLSFYPLLHTLL